MLQKEEAIVEIFLDHSGSADLPNEQDAEKPDIFVCVCHLKVL